jgi:hypothetical protein
MGVDFSGSLNISGSMTATTIIVSAPGAPGMVSSSNQLVELNTATGSLIGITNGLMGVTASLNLKTGSYATTGSNTFNGNQSISGSISASGMIDSNGLTLTKNNFTIDTQGSISYHDVVGLTLKGKSASVFDFSYYNPYGNAVITNPINSNDINFNTGSVLIGMGNLKFNTAGQGIDFSATSNSSGTMTSELLNDYEEGTWTPTLTDNASANVYSSGTRYGFYTKVGRIVTATAVFDATTCVAGNSVKVGGLPFTVTNTESRYPGFNSHTMGTAISSTTIHGGYARQAETNFQLLQRDSNITVNFASGTFSMFLTFIYVV